MTEKEKECDEKFEILRGLKSRFRIGILDWPVVEVIKTADRVIALETELLETVKTSDFDKMSLLLGEAIRLLDGFFQEHYVPRALN